ncbi:unnamed protein product [Ambrosiozyma monospora]|uniref:Unnamed protein product n=1 Tax=Ambrosiozyma monospora TaxID=43982 RepID=A0ACB5U461_AMBMO|nr:unnamed protein product [Ambrosiozyma monospora]
MIVSEVDSYGKAVVLISEDLERLLQRQEILCSTGLVACIRSCRDVFRENMCDDIVKWLSDFVHSNFVKSNHSVLDILARALLRRHLEGYANAPVPVSKEAINLSPAFLRYIPFQDVFPAEKKWDISDDLKRECEYGDLTITLPRGGSYNFQASRLQKLIFFDVSLLTSMKIYLLYFYQLTENQINQFWSF